jgi:hypothetical protein
MKTSTILQTAAVLLVAAAVAAAFTIAPLFASAKSSDNKIRTVESGTTVSIANNGSVLVRGAEVTAVSGDVITARTQWGDTNISWKVETDNDTNFLQKNGSTVSASDIKAGNTVSFAGTLDADAGSFSVDADVVKNWSLASGTVALTGTVTSLNDDADSFVMRLANGTNVTVTTSGSTTIKGGTFGDVDVNDRIVVSGTYTSGTSVLAASKIGVDLEAKVGKGLKLGHWKDFLGKLGFGSK